MMMMKRDGSPRGFAVLFMLAALGGCDQNPPSAASGESEPVLHARSAAGDGTLCGYVYAEPNFQGKQVPLTSTGTCDEVPLPELFGNVGSAALSPNCTIDLFSGGTNVVHTEPSTGTRPTVAYDAALGNQNITSYTCQCGDENYPLVAEAQEMTGRDIASGENTLPLWARGIVDVTSLGDGAWFSTKIAALYYPTGKGAVLAGLDEGRVAFPVGAQSEGDKILDLATEYSAGIESVSEEIAGKPLEPSDYEDISESIVSLTPYRVTQF